MAHEIERPISSAEIPQDIPIEIGTATYRLSPEAQEYLAKVGFPRQKYEKSRSVLIIQEPHYDVEKQFNLYKFLEFFFEDNPDLVAQTIFLAEGHPANQPISLQPLIEISPRPSDRLIYETLGSFLITGYMAYEWKHQHGIPIIGTEDPTLYRLSSKLWPFITQETASLWDVSVVARNESLARTLFERTKTHENPILFVGGKHLTDRITGDEFAELRTIKPEKFLQPEELGQLKGFRNWTIEDYLKLARLGYTFVDPLGETLGDPDQYLNIYRLLLVAQHRGNYDEYIDLLLSERGYTVAGGPSSESAAKFASRILKVQSRNPQATEAADRGFSSEREGKFLEAAGEYSAATAADPQGPPGYLLSIQLALIKEVKARIIRASKDPRKFKGINPGIKSDVPVYGPYGEKDHIEKVTRFSQRFANVPGAQEVIINAMHEDWKIRSGGAFQVKVAEAIGPEPIRAFEERHKLPGGGTLRIDIATKKNVAVECKNFNWKIPSSQYITYWVEQAISHLQPNEEGHKYHSTLIVIPNTHQFDQIKTLMNQQVKAQAPHLYGKIQLCQLKDVSEVLSKLKRWW